MGFRQNVRRLHFGGWWILSFLLPFGMWARLGLLFSILVLARGALPLYQRDSLIDFYTATGGNSWFNSAGWNTSTDPCGTPVWYGVSCNSAPEVTGIGLYRNNLVGTLPDLLLPKLSFL